MTFGCWRSAQDLYLRHPYQWSSKNSFLIRRCMPSIFSVLATKMHFNKTTQKTEEWRCMTCQSVRGRNCPVTESLSVIIGTLLVTCIFFWWNWIKFWKLWESGSKPKNYQDFAAKNPRGVQKKERGGRRKKSRKDKRRLTKMIEGRAVFCCDS